MSKVVFDAEPLIAYLYDETGAAKVEETLTKVYDEELTGLLSEVTATEIVYKIARLNADGAADDEDLNIGRNAVDDFLNFGLELISTDSSWDVAAEVKADGGISLGDSFAVAVAVEHDATLVVGADGDFDDLSVGVDVERIRETPA